MPPREPDDDDSALERDRAAAGGEDVAAHRVDDEGLRRNLETVGSELIGLVKELAEDRLRDPHDDLLTRLVMENADGEKLSPQELGAFFNLLVGAGNETTLPV